MIVLTVIVAIVSAAIGIAIGWTIFRHQSATRQALVEPLDELLGVDEGHEQEHARFALGGDPAGADLKLGAVRAGHDCFRLGVEYSL